MTSNDIKPVSRSISLKGMALARPTTPLAGGGGHGRLGHVLITCTHIFNCFYFLICLTTAICLKQNKKANLRIKNDKVL